MSVFHIICNGQLRDSYLREAAAEYEKRLSPYFRVKTTETDDRGMLSALTARAYKFALCVEGIQLSSEEFASKIDGTVTAGYSDIAFVIGGADGLPEKIKAACDMRLSFSRMTFPHRLMRVILLEQLYRAVNIIRGGKYHH
jgi:23S rRNA (pseudouridine1915-N3)-methyltransferase